ncbi:ribosomal RNA small subunit methyltransferase G [Dellaglioa algida]|uniref:Ribosomal RNA small subunit methyltransferase G n=2 Tax=Dellaglioa TaxID=2767880 RepID=A0A5C6MCT8_9LACO|nr:MULTISPECIES: 16S rRNA (guanine(527)-N(7))-methyltransferase RsmG [Dellaglioa]MCZ2491224.1 16S rRNA (guanine(527)-N(7))-methyltransferase RsmG [Dellaglioa carnosa]MCZ2493456.1 16S rRNA (guanine(527)-N(7))-methyltransferase RsmG [Dellaglioa carnosa]MCZ2494302.1 16S rRNA (guanine(527)-N(7))-methyltransferase RsmG [Dellaglioa carnosa]MDK1716189.1 16S rRNA (guanine(527)-N(7))-methyltransferase RsmG [Dellaglioa algida]MDK1719470.1 16S rRNA (guanine(527)-N(7))-methyltransferase RsmG [Dellaglioa a
MNPEEFRQSLAEKGINLTDRQMAQFETYYEFLVMTNENLNLTAITEKSDVYLKHFYDSLTPAFYSKEIQSEPLSICDVGAGAGFPSIPLKIAFPQLTVTIVDSLNKRINFLNELADKLDITGVAFFHNRAEEFAGKKSLYREQYDIVTARAVARLSVLSELCLPLVKLNGQFIALKAQKMDEELADAEYAIKLLGGQVKVNHEFNLPISNDERHLLVVDKIKLSPKKYPRKAGVPGRTPLVAKL